MKRWKTWIRGAAVVALMLAVVAGIGTIYAGRFMRRLDTEHARFLECGQSINLFLKHYGQELVRAQQSGDLGPVLAAYVEDYRSPGRGHWKLGPEVDLGSAALSRFEANGRDDYRCAELSVEFAEYLAGLSDVKSVKCKINLIEDVVPDESAVITVKYILDGRDHHGRLLEDRFFFRWRLRKATLPSGLRDWRIVGDELVGGERVAGFANGFLSPTPSTVGVDYVHRRDPKLDPSTHALKFAVIQHSSGGISAVDFDDDTLVDLFFSDGLQSRLYKNVTNLGASSALPAFRDVTTEAGLDGIDQAQCALFVDIDNDGDRDLYVVRYLAPGRLFINRGDGTFTDASRGSGLDFVIPATAATFFDYDGDGRPDLYVGSNGNAFKASPNIPFYATNGEPNRLYRNVDGRRFEDVTAASGTGDTGWTLAVTASDFDGDGHVDLGVANDFGRKILYRNNGNGTFTDVTKAAGVLDFSGGMGLAFGDMNFDGRPDLYTSNINSNQRWFGEEVTLWQYGRNLWRSGWLSHDFAEMRDLYNLLGDDWRKLGKMIGEGNSLFFNQGDGTFREIQDSGTDRAGWSWGVALLDMDNDTDLDIVVSNGWISGKNQDDL